MEVRVKLLVARWWGRSMKSNKKLPSQVWIAGNESEGSGISIYGIFATEEEAKLYLKYYQDKYMRYSSDCVWSEVTGFKYLQ